jgi:hypothetical protein
MMTLAVVQQAFADTYSLTTSTIGQDFFSDYEFQTFPDPTNGRVNYTDQATAQADNLATVLANNTFVMSVDSTTTLSSTGPGRNSVRLQSVQSYNTHTVVVDVAHMPQGLATWPAFWEVGPNWPNEGEIDIIEGVNDVVPNQSTLHTAAGCTMPTNNTAMTGTVLSGDCNANDNGNAGCGVHNNKANNYGPQFNAIGGGWYAMEKTNTSINVWFWARNDNTVPSAVATGGRSIDTSTFGTPYANFGNSQCDIATTFGPQNIVIDTTLCGDFAGALFNADGGSGDCNTFVEQNPSAFSEAFWAINSVNVYE